MERKRERVREREMEREKERKREPMLAKAELEKIGMIRMKSLNVDSTRKAVKMTTTTATTIQQQ